MSKTNQLFGLLALLLRDIIRSFLLVSFLSAIFASIMLYQATHRVLVSEEQTILIKTNTTNSQVAQQFYGMGIAKNPYFFEFLIKTHYFLTKKPIRAGEYVLKKGSNFFNVMNILTTGKIVQHKLLIPQGFTTKQVIERLNNLDNVRSLPGLDTMLDLSEGSLLPETYFYAYNTSDLDLLKRMQDAMQDFIKKAWPARDKKIDNIISSPEEAIILASIVEKETYIDSEKPIIAGVYLNRLKRNMKLQACPTVIYGLELGENEIVNRRLLYSHLRYSSPYNTYTNKGLPPTPICNPGMKAIKAVLHPHWTNQLFFVANKNGRHMFAENFAEHRMNIRMVRQKN